MKFAAVLFASALAAQFAQSRRPPCEQVAGDTLTDTAVPEICAGDDAAR